MRAAVTESGPRLLRRRDPMPRRQPRSRTLAMVARAALQATLLVGVPVGLVGWVALSGYFLVDQVTVRAGERVATSWATTALDTVQGRHILALSLDDVARPLAEHPWVASVAVTKELPRGLVVKVEEKEPLAVWQRAEQSYYLDREGAVIASTEDEELAQLLPHLIWPDGEPVPVAGSLALLEELRTLRPAWAASVRQIEILSDEDYRMALGSTPYQIIVRAGTLDGALSRLDRALQEIGDRAEEVGIVDLRLPRRVVLRTAEPTVERTNQPGPRGPVATEEG